MFGLLIADDDLESRRHIADLFIEAGYHVTVTNSVAHALYGVLKKTAQVVLISSQFDELTAVDLIPLLKHCDRDLTIILIGSEDSLAATRKARKEGIFYHALKPMRPDDGEEIRLAVKCAYERLVARKQTLAYS